MFLHATAAEGLADKPDVSVKWVHSRDLNVSDDGTIRDLEGVCVRCVWKSASWRYLCSVPQPDIVAKLLYSPQVHVYQVPSTALKAFILIYFDAFFGFYFLPAGAALSDVPPPPLLHQPLWTALIDCPEFLSFVRSSVADGSLSASAGACDGLQAELNAVFLKVSARSL
jgi:hypothetical protein